MISGDKNQRTQMMMTTTALQTETTNNRIKSNIQSDNDSSNSKNNTNNTNKDIQIQEQLLPSVAKRAAVYLRRSDLTDSY